MRNPVLAEMDILVGEWNITLSDAWFLEASEQPQHGHATVRWLGEAFIEMTAEMNGEPTWHFVFGRSDANERLLAFYHDPRPASRVFEMTFGGGEWSMRRADPDMHQGFAGTVTGDRIDLRVDASDDAGVTWRKDFDLVFERVRR
ncbi:MAG TPA: hypothetical protein VFX21_13060 [Acidimicrobiia bacterium]|nr:hypothetical protein [Acidimicrobiia bacterium]